MIELTLAELARLVGGRLHRATGDERITGTVEFDSRAVTPGGLFVALPGERVDGHAFATTAAAAGAAGVLAAREVDAPAVVVDPLPDADVPDAAHDGAGAAVLVALQTLARHVVDALPQLQVTGITGSSGSFAYTETTVPAPATARSRSRFAPSATSTRFPSLLWTASRLPLATCRR